MSARGITTNGGKGYFRWLLPSNSLPARAVPNDTIPADPAGLRAKFVLYLAYETGLRQFELANARCGHLRRVAVDDEDTEAWVLDVCGKRNKI